MNIRIRSQPIRMCCACKQRKEKYLLDKFVIKNNNVIIDKYYKESGRGAYICKNIECLNKAKKYKALNKALKININDEIYDQLKKELFCDKE